MVTAVPSMGQIIDLGDLSDSLMMHTTGESGHPGHRHYDDMIDSWRHVTYHPSLWTRAVGPSLALIGRCWPGRCGAMRCRRPSWRCGKEDGQGNCNPCTSVSPDVVGYWVTACFTSLRLRTNSRAPSRSWKYPAYPRAQARSHSCLLSGRRGVASLSSRRRYADNRSTKT